MIHFAPIGPPPPGWVRFRDAWVRDVPGWERAAKRHAGWRALLPLMPQPKCAGGCRVPPRPVYTTLHPQGVPG